MTLHLPEARVRELFERWRRGEVSLRGAAREMGCEVRTVQRRFAKWDAGCRARAETLNRRAREAYWRQVSRTLDDSAKRARKLRDAGDPQQVWTN